MKGHTSSMTQDTVHNHAKAKEKVAFWSIIASVLITIFKGITGLLTGSLALISDALNSLTDILSTSITWLAIRSSHHPADESHHYGHGKIESLAALFESMVLFLMGGFICYEGFQRLFLKSNTTSFSWLAIIVLIIAIVIDGWRWWVLKRTSKQVGGSEALEADALHFAADLLNSILVLLAFAAIYFGFLWADALAAIGTALFMFITSGNLALRTIATLIDTAPKGIAERISQISLSVSGVVSVIKIRVRPAGTHIFADLSISVSRTLPLEKVLKIKQMVSERIRLEIPQMDVQVIAEPVSLDTESILERVMVIAARERLFIHHVTVQDLLGRICIGLDLEVDGQLSIGEAHKIASRLEQEIFNELGSNIEVDTHIEPLRVGSLIGADEREAVVRSLTNALKKKASEIGNISDIHSIRIRRSSEGIIIHYHCRFDPSLPVNQVHSLVDELEWRFRLDHPDVIRVVAHAEPFKDLFEQNLN